MNFLIYIGIICLAIASAIKFLGQYTHDDGNHKCECDTCKN